MTLRVGDKVRPANYPAARLGELTYVNPEEDYCEILYPDGWRVRSNLSEYVKGD